MGNASKRIQKPGTKIILDSKGAKAPRSDDIAKKIPHKKG